MKDKLIYSLLIISFILITGCNNKTDILKGTWKASIENQNIYKVGNDTVGGQEDYYLECDGKGYYELKTKKEDLANASYKINKNTVTFYDEGKEILAICEINNNELDCSRRSNYAFRYIKIK